MRKTLFIVCMVFLIAFSPLVTGSVKVSPGKLVVDIDKGFPDDEYINYSLKVTNNNAYDVVVSVDVRHPFDLKSGYVRIPDLSWLKVSKDNFVIPAKSYDWVEIELDIPKDMQESSFNQNWESWVFVIPKKASGSGGVGFETQLAVPVFIDTPSGVVSDSSSGSDNFFVVFAVFLFLIVGFVVLNFFRARRKRFSGKSKVFYFDKNNEE